MIQLYISPAINAEHHIPVFQLRKIMQFVTVMVIEEVPFYRIRLSSMNKTFNYSKIKPINSLDIDNDQAGSLIRHMASISIYTL
jgi:hypothetical protein